MRTLKELVEAAETEVFKDRLRDIKQAPLEVINKEPEKVECISGITYLSKMLNELYEHPSLLKKMAICDYRMFQEYKQIGFTENQAVELIKANKKNGVTI